MTITLHTDASLYAVGNDRNSVLGSDIDATQTTIPVSDGSLFSTAGGIVGVVSSETGFVNNVERITYTGVSGNDLTGCTRGTAGTTAAPANSGDVVEERPDQAHHNALKDGLKTTAQDVYDLTTGAESFTSVYLQLVQTGATFESRLYLHPTTGDLELQFNLDNGHNFAIRDGDGSSGDKRRFFVASSGTSVSVAANTFDGYPVDEMVDASKLGFSFNPDRLSGVDAEGNFQFNALKDQSDPLDVILVVRNGGIFGVGTPVFAVQKDLTEAQSLKSSDGVLNLPVKSADPGSPSDGDLWILDPATGNNQLRARISGVTYGVDLT